MATTHRNGVRQSSSSRASQRKGQMPVGEEWLKDFLSEMLAVEKGGVKLYEKALRELEHTELEQKLSDFLRQTERHVELCTEMLEAAAGDPNYQGPGAEAADHKAEGLLSTQVPAELTDLNNIENLVLAETKDHWDWDMLASVAPKIAEPELKRMASKAIREVRKQEQAHLNWNEQTLTKLAMEMATQPPERETAEEAESMENNRVCNVIGRKFWQPKSSAQSVRQYKKGRSRGEEETHDRTSLIGRSYNFGQKGRRCGKNEALAISSAFYDRT
jgi:rubrerythrin